MSIRAIKNIFSAGLASWSVVAARKAVLHQRPHSSLHLLSRTMAHSLGISSGQPHPGKPNKLINSKSPYLLQHAYNPVDWYPWGEEAFDKAKRESKLIFLSVGYSTCHWCHVMERESFENKDIAELMNKDFVNVKVDREERPDVDRMYMNFVRAISGGGGWPMSVFLTPDLKPVYGGTYYPPDDRYNGRPGFRSVLASLSEQWKSDPGKFNNSGEKIVAMLSQSASLGRAIDIPPAEHCTKLCFDQLERSYEPRFGGFGERPKFPQPVNLHFLMRSHVRGIGSSRDDRKALDMCLHTLRSMAKGGIFDHVGLGFARYSTDGEWHVPHFEKMLYDQAQLASAYTDAYLLTGDADLARVVRDILTYATNDMTDPSGGFYSAEDADSYPEEGAKEKREGAFYVWTWKEVRDALSEDEADVVCHHFDVRPNGNVDPYQDPHDELKGRNVLVVRASADETARKFGRTPDEVQSLLESALRKLKRVRDRRPRPHLDDKMLAAWNGLMLSALAKAGVVLEEDAYVERAVMTAEFMREHLFDAESGRLLRSCYRGPDGVRQNLPPIEGFLDDYAFAVRGLLDLHAACQDEKWLEWAEELQSKLDELFWDEREGAYFSSAAGDPNILIRLKDDQDGAEPSGNSIAAGNLERLAALLDRDDLRARSTKLLRAFGQRLAEVPLALPEMVSALQLHEDSPTEVVIVGDRASETGRALWRAAVTHPKSVLGQAVVRLDPDAGGLLAERRPSLASMRRGAAYVCRHRSCSPPAASPDELRRLLDA